MIEECSESTPKTKPKYEQDSIDEFLGLSREAKANAKNFVYRFGPEDKDKIEWTILADSEQITVCPMEQEKAEKEKAREDEYRDGNGASESKDTSSPIKKDIPWDPDPSKVDYNAIMLENFFPDLKGKAEVLDKWLSNKRCKVYRTAQNDNISFTGRTRRTRTCW